MNNKSKLLIVEDDPKIVELLKKYIISLGYICDVAENGYEGLRKIHKNDYDLVLSDIKMPVMDGMEMIRQLRGMNASLPVVVIISGHAEKTQMRDAIRIGAQDYLFKPINFEEMEIAIRKGLNQNRLIRENISYELNLESKVIKQTEILRNQNEELEKANVMIYDSYLDTVESLCQALDLRDHATETHSKRVLDWSDAIARKLNLPDKDLATIRWGAILHDIGKIGVPDSILLKPAKLNDAEWDIMKRHPRMGYEILKKSKFLKEALPIVLHHHEKWDGSGYPAGLQGEEIPIGARIFSVADSYDAMTSDRPYRKAMSKENAIQELKINSGTQFDPEIVDIFLTILD